MKNRGQGFRDTFFAGLIFLLPLLVLLVIVFKVFQIFNKITGKLASILGINSILGISASTIVAIVSLVLLCILFGYLIRITFFKNISQRVDRKLRQLVPGYEVYHTMILSKINNNEEMLPYKSAAWVNSGAGTQPGFIIETTVNNKIVVFIPAAGNVKEGTVLVMDPSQVQPCPDVNMKLFRLAISNLGIGISAMAK